MSRSKAPRKAVLTIRMTPAEYEVIKRAVAHWCHVTSDVASVNHWCLDTLTTAAEVQLASGPKPPGRM